MRVAAIIEEKLSQSLSPTRLVVTDDSDRHIGHAGAKPEGQTHYSVEIVSARFEGLSRVARQRLVYEALAEQLAGGLHALAMRTLTPDEDSRS